LSPLPLPDFFAPASAGRWDYRPDAQGLAERAAGWRRQHGLRPAGEARRKVLLLIVDAQRDFCLPEGALYVGGRSGRGAIEDNARLAAFIYRHLDQLTEVSCTLDTHHPYQIFFPSFWVDAAGRQLLPYREISAAEIERGEVRPNPDLTGWLGRGDPAWLARQAAWYCRELEREGKYRLFLWPPHCLAGSAGHALVGAIDEARLFFAFCRAAPTPIEIKGEYPLTEHYSVLAPEVLGRHDGGPLAVRNRALIERLLAADRLLVAGQAASHCVKATVEDLLEEIRRRDPALAKKVVLLVDCMSAVAVPDPALPGAFLADFTADAERAFARFAAAGVQLARSTEPLEL